MKPYDLGREHIFHGCHSLRPKNIGRYKLDHSCLFYAKETGLYFIGIREAFKDINYVNVTIEFSFEICFLHKKEV